MLPSGFVDGLLGAGHEVLLRDDIEGDRDHLRPRRRAGALRCADPPHGRATARRPALLVFGTRHPGYFNAGQGTELLSFLARVIEHCLRLWLGLKA